jgi:hypothetical protein
MGGTLKVGQRGLGFYQAGALRKSHPHTERFPFKVADPRIGSYYRSGRFRRLAQDEDPAGRP